ncbi:MAG: hypothetical protein FWG13_04150 [Leptospirales bacterium]|nr:hypothetical protein [Leptospirales bacterium]
MKTKLLLSAFILCLAHASAFAIVDVNLYGGYTIGGKHQGRGVKFGDDNGHWGLLAHINATLLKVFQFGVGPYYQSSTVTYGNPKNHWSADKKDIGIDGFAALDIPLIPLSPYLRGGTSAWNRVKYSYGTETNSFERYHAGGGVLLTILPLPLFKLQMFTEYIRFWGKEGGLKSTEHQLNVGLRGNIL